jgi:hypothetical protein
MKVRQDGTIHRKNISCTKQLLITKLFFSPRDILASWNFKHIVNLDRIKGYNSVNLRLGYAMIEFRSPKDLIKYGED